jgi:hypothetical protein
MATNPMNRFRIWRPTGYGGVMVEVKPVSVEVFPMVIGVRVEKFGGLTVMDTWGNEMILDKY